VRRRFRSVAPLWAAAALAAAACGYTFRGTLPEHIQTIAIPVFANHTAEPAVENAITRAVAEAFSTNGRLRVVTPERADSILEGVITGYELLSIAYDPSANVRQYRLLVTMNLSFRDVRENKMLFQRSGFQERADFRVLGAVSETLALEADALRVAAVQIGQAVVSAALDRF
jgi:outer membrane lipopolysaccharide assembly protein LptE/RlpB